MITVKNLSKHFGGIKAVDGVDLHIERGSITGLVGPNGAGKTTMFNLCCVYIFGRRIHISNNTNKTLDLTQHLHTDAKFSIFVPFFPRSER